MINFRRFDVMRWFLMIRKSYLSNFMQIGASFKNHNLPIMVVMIVFVEDSGNYSQVLSQSWLWQCWPWITWKTLGESQSTHVVVMIVTVSTHGSQKKTQKDIITKLWQCPQGMISLWFQSHFSDFSRKETWDQ